MSLTASPSLQHTAVLHAHHESHGSTPPPPDVPFSRPGTPRLQPLQLGFCGLGNMGYYMARNLARHRHSHPAGSLPLLVYNRTRAKSEELLKELGADHIEIAESPEQLATECEVIFTNLASDAVVIEVYGKFKQALVNAKHDKPRIFVETSTTFPNVAGQLDELLSESPNTHLITCPVFGPPAAADKAQLIIVMSGDYRSKKEVAYLLVPAVGKKAIDLGGNLQKAPTLKLLGNSMILGFIEVIAEAITMGEKAGIEPDAALHCIKELFPNTPISNYAAKIAHDDFDGSKGFGLDGGLKDASHIRRLTSELNAPMPVVDIAHQHMLTARALHEAQKVAGTQSFNTLDWSALVAGPRVAAGLDGLDSSKHIKVEKDE